MFTNALISCNVAECSLMFDFLKPKVVNITVIDDNTQRQYCQEIPIDDLNDVMIEKTVKFGIYKVKELPKM